MSQGRMYTIPIAFGSRTAALDLAEMLAATNSFFRIHEIRITQDTEVGDAQAEQLHFFLKKGTGSYTSGSAGSTPTLTKHNPGDANAQTTVEVNNTTQAVAGSGALTVILEIAEHVANGWHYLPTPAQLITFVGAQAAIISMSAPADAVNVGGYIVFEEIG